ncbi:adenylate/guanylate cyclase domain-containing protein [uncultured Roseibium sp.]|uniref:adenylate/guanylate cyclase domain-containing protein n=1 Tax=uncultured Roseibium sp. TaxID=1936171 RepID=UPI003216E7D8
METDFPDLNLKYEFKRPIINKDYSVDTNIIYISTSLKKNLSEKNEKTEYTELQNEVEKLANKINVLTKKYTAESQKSQRLENELRELSIDYLKYIRSNKELENPSSEILSVMFLDIVSFSSMSGSEKDSILDFLRNIAPPLIRERAAKNINMWGDGIVATFSDPNDALDVSARFVRHLAVEQLEARVGIAWGVVRTSFNKTTGRVDISGDTVDFAARIESLAHPGEILLSSDFSELEINTNTYSLVPTNRKLGKAVLNYDPGDTLKLWHLSVRKN